LIEPIDYANSEDNVAGFADIRSAVSGILVSGNTFSYSRKILFDREDSRTRSIPVRCTLASLLSKSGHSTILSCGIRFAIESSSSERTVAKLGGWQAEEKWRKF